MGAIIGISVGSILAMIYLVIRSHKDRGRLSPGADRADDNRTILRTLLRLAIPITVGNAATSVVTLVDTSIVNHLLQRMFENMPELITAEAYAQELVENGLPATLYMARGLKGIYDKCMGVYNLPSAMMMPLTISVVPAVSACLARRDHKGASRITESVLRVGAMLAMPAGIGICALGGPITELLFPGKMDTSIAGPIMSTLGIASIFVCTMLLCTSILQGHGIVNLPAATVVIGGIVKVIVNYILVGNPEINVKGAPYGTMCCFAVVTILDMIIIKRILPVPPSYVRAFGKPLVASVLMGLTAWAGNGLMSRVLLKMSAFRRVSEAGVAVLSGTGNAIATLGAVFLGVVVYAVLIVVLHVVSKEDLELMPKGDKIAKILHIR